MKVLVLSTVFPNPAQSVHGLFVFERIRHTANHCEVRVVAPVPWIRRTKRPAIPASEIRDQVHVEHPTFFYLPRFLKCLDGLFLFFSVLPSIRRLRTQFDFDLIDVHFAYPEGMAGILLGRWFSRPVVITLRGAEITLSRFKVRARLMRWTLAQAEHVIAVSQQLAELAAALGARPDRIRVIENGVDSGRFTPIDRQVARQRLGIPRGGTWLLAVGRLVPGKGLHRIVRALRSAQRDIPDIALAIIGGAGPDSGSYPRELRRLIKELGLSKEVHLLGPKPNDEVVLWLNAADAFVLASEREGCPNVVWEALACGRPVVASKVGSIDMMVPPFAGMLYDAPDDVAALKRCLLSTLSRSWDVAAIRAHAQMHTWERVAVRVVAVWALACQSFRAVNRDLESPAGKIGESGIRGPIV
jgi:glycosyltransferase involved in cell wall biosynthesis